MTDSSSPQHLEDSSSSGVSTFFSTEVLSNHPVNNPRPSPSSLNQFSSVSSSRSSSSQSTSTHLASSSSIPNSSTPFFQSKDIGRKPTPVYFQDIQDKPLKKFQEFIKRHHRIVNLSLVGVIILIIATVSVFFVAKHFSITPPPVAKVVSPPPATTLLDEVGDFLIDRPGTNTYESLERRLLDYLATHADLSNQDHVSHILALNELYQSRRLNRESIELLNRHLDSTTDPTSQLRLLLALYAIYSEDSSSDSPQKIISLLERIVAFPDETDLVNENWSALIKSALTRQLAKLKSEFQAEQAAESDE